MDSANDPLIGTLVAGRYRVQRLLGEGGMGQVFLAEHEAIEKKIALKVLRPEYSHKPEIVTRFQQEAISASRIKHPNVLDVFDFGALDNGCFFLAMEFLDGHDLADELVQSQTVSPDRGVVLALQICRALAAAHARGVVHRDMKPENVFLQRTQDGEEIVKIVDFGIAQLRGPGDTTPEVSRRRLTRTGMIFGTPEYMSPEQAGGRTADHRADIYAVGIILYEIFTNAVPFTGETFLGVLNKHQHDPVPPMKVVNPAIEVTPELQLVIERALAKRPEERYQSMAELAAAIAASPEGQLVRTRPKYASNPELIKDLPSIPPPAPRLTPATPVPLNGPEATAVSRAQTQLGAGVPVRPESKPRWGLIATTAVVVAAASVGGFFAFEKRSSSEPPPAPLPSTSLAEVVSALPPDPRVIPVPSAPSAEPKPEVVPTTAAPITMVRLDVQTTPPGAILKKNGFQVCDTTPCEVLATPNETLEFLAIKGNRSGKAQVLAQRDQRVSIALGALPLPPSRPSEKICEVEVDGIKILRPCR